MRQEKISCKETGTRVMKTVQFAIKNTFTNGITRVRYGEEENEYLDPGASTGVERAAGGPLHIWLENSIPDSIPVRIMHHSTSGSADNYTCVINRTYDEDKGTPMLQIIQTGPIYANAKDTTANVTVGDGEP